MLLLPIYYCYFVTEAGLPSAVYFIEKINTVHIYYIDCDLYLILHKNYKLPAFIFNTIHNVVFISCI